MKSAALAMAALLALSLAGCADDPERTPGTSSSSSSGSPAPTATSSGSATRTSSSPSSTPTSTGTTTNTPPTADLSVTPASGAAPLAVNFTAGGSDADGGSLSWTLVFGDGNQTTGTTLPATVPHTYAKAGNFTASLTVSDGELNRTATTKVTATGPAAPTAPTIEELCPTDANAVGHEAAGVYATPLDNVDSPGTLWIYEESNGMPGLQRDDDTVPTDCPTPDTIVF